jgi:ribosomal protein S18 acetylase RimI-like enzyme
MWREARPEDDDAVVDLALALYREDPGEAPVEAAQVRHTLETFRREPWRGRALVLDQGGTGGYALLVSFWSSELGGEVCEVDELYVAPSLRGRGHGTALFDALSRGELWPGKAAALSLSVTPGNARARRLYERLGFRATWTRLVRR